MVSGCKTQSNNSITNLNANVNLIKYWNAANGKLPKAGEKHMKQEWNLAPETSCKTATYKISLPESLD